MQKLCFVLPNLDYHGIARQVSLLAPLIVREGFQVDVVSLGGDGPFSASLRDSGIAIHMLESLRLFDFHRWLAARRLLRELQPDIVHLCDYSTLDALRLGWLGSWEPFPKLIFSPRGDASNRSSSNWWSKRSFRHVSQIMVNFESEKSLLDSNVSGLREIEVIPPAVATEFGIPSSIELRKSLQLPDDAKIILTVGPMDCMEPLRDAIWGFDVLRYIFKNAYLLIAGDGPQRSELDHFGFTNAPHDYRIRYLGYRSDLRELIQSVDMVWMPLQKSGGTNVILESMAAKRPIVAVEMPNTVSLIEDGKTGMLIRSKEATEFTRITKSLFEDPEKGKEIGFSAYQYVTQHHNPVEITRKLCSIYGRAKI
jgi:glycosyltransferase involved in cell wall biosynthesis